MVSASTAHYVLSENKITRVERKSGGSTKREKRERERENRGCVLVKL